MEADELTRPGEHFGNLGVVMIGIVVKEEKLFDSGKQRQCDDVVHAAVTPADVGLIFSVVVLGIDDEHIGVLEELDDLLVLFAGEFQRFEAIGCLLAARVERRSVAGRSAAGHESVETW